MYQYFGGNFCLHPQGRMLNSSTWRWEKQVPPPSQQISTHV